MGFLFVKFLLICSYLHISRSFLLTLHCCNHNGEEEIDSRTFLLQLKISLHSATPAFKFRSLPCFSSTFSSFFRTPNVNGSKSRYSEFKLPSLDSPTSSDRTRRYHLAFPWQHSRETTALLDRTTAPQHSLPINVHPQDKSCYSAFSRHHYPDGHGWVRSQFDESYGSPVNHVASISGGGRESFDRERSERLKTC